MQKAMYAKSYVCKWRYALVVDSVQKRCEAKL